MADQLTDDEYEDQVFSVIADAIIDRCPNLNLTFNRVENIVEWVLNQDTDIGSVLEGHGFVRFVQDIAADKTALETGLDKLFTELTANGYLARQNYMCCPECASESIFEEALELESQGAFPKGIVYYDSVQADDATEIGQVEISFESYCQSENPTEEEHHQGAQTTGNAVVELAAKCGLVPEWDGNCDHAIVIKALLQ